LAKRRRKPGSIGLRLLRFGQERVETYVPGGSTLHRKPEDTTWMETLSPDAYDSSDFDAELVEAQFFTEDTVPFDEKIALELPSPPEPDQKRANRASDESTHPISQQPVKPILNKPITSDAKPTSAPLQRRSASPNDALPVKRREPSVPNTPTTQSPPRKTPSDLLAILEAHEGKRRGGVSMEQPEQDEAPTQKATTSIPRQEQIQRTPKTTQPDAVKRPRRAQLHEITPYSKQKSAEEAEISEHEHPEKSSIDSLHEDDFTYIDDASPFASFTVDEENETATQIDSEVAQNTEQHASDEQLLKADILDQAPSSEEPIDQALELINLDDGDFDYDGETIKLDNDVTDDSESDSLPPLSPDNTIIQPKDAGEKVIERKPLNMPKTEQPRHRDSALSQDETISFDFPSPEAYMHDSSEDYQLPSIDTLGDLEEGIPTEQMTPIDSPMVLQPQLESPFTYFAGPKALPQEPTATESEKEPYSVENHESWSNIQLDADISSVAHHDNVDMQSQVTEHHEVSESYDDPIIAESEFELNSFDDEGDETALMTFDRPYPSGKIHRQLEILTPTSHAEIHDNVDDSIPQSDSPEADLLRLLNLPPDTPVAGLKQNRLSSQQPVQRQQKQVQSVDDMDDYEHPMQAIPLDVALLSGVETPGKTTTAPLQRLSFDNRPDQTNVTEHSEAGIDDAVEDVETKGQDNVDVDKLARDVLKRLRHRLRIEQERGTKR